MERSKLRRHESELVPEEVNCNMIVQATFLLLFGILFPFCGCSTREQFSLIKISNGTYYLFNKLTNTLREIIEDPLETISCLDFQITDATLVANDFAAKIPHEMPVTSLKQKDTSPDEVLRVIIQKVLIFQPHNLILKIHPSINNCFNPSIVWWEGHIMISWRSEAVGGWQSTYSKFGWLSSDRYTIDSTSLLLGVNDSLVLKNPDRQTEPHLLRLRNNSMLLVFATNHQHHHAMYFTVGSIVLDIISFGPTFQLQLSDAAASQKNWMPFQLDGEGDDRVLFIQNINPYCVVEIVRTYNNSDESHVAVTASVHRNNSQHLPWDESRYGHLRGGTPGLPMVKYGGAFLFFFHAMGEIQHPNRHHSYTMGAMVVCNTPPFHITRMSRFPLIPSSSWYEGKWMYKNHDYVLYPGGLMMDPLDNDRLLVSIGHQDQHAFVVEFSVDVLWDSMDAVETCGHTSKQQR